MGNCCRRFLNIFYKRRVLRNYTSLERTQALNEAEDLFDDSDGDGLMDPGSASSYSSFQSPSAITENEKLFLKSKNYAAIINSQKAYDDQIDKQLAEQEEKLRREEEELIRQRKSRDQTKSFTGDNTATHPTRSSTNTVSKASSSVQDGTDTNPWEGGDDSEWNTAGGEDDFDMFLDSIATRERSNKESAGDEIGEEDFVSGFTPSS